LPTFNFLEPKSGGTKLLSLHEASEKEFFSETILSF